MNTQTPSDRSPMPSALMFALQLLPAAPGAEDAIAGRVEHVLSGRRQDFAGGAALLACLALEQAQLRHRDGPDALAPR